MNIAIVGVDLAKSVLQVHAVDSQGQVVVRKQLRRADVLRYFAKLEPCVIGMEACASSHYWGREFAKQCGNHHAIDEHMHGSHSYRAAHGSINGYCHIIDGLASEDVKPQHS